MAQVYLPRSLLNLFPAAERRPVVEAATVDELIGRLDARWPGMRARLCEAGPRLREHINVFVDGERATLATPLEPTSTVHVIPAVSGGVGQAAPGRGPRGARNRPLNWPE
jgi:molybdopterin converting factor small subunit